MSAQLGFDKCLPFLNVQFTSAGPALEAVEELPRIVVTISRQTGCGAHEIARQLSSFLSSHAPNPSCPWMVFDRNLVEKVLEDHNLPSRLAHYMPEDYVSDLTDALDELLGAHPPSWALVRQTSETILRLARRGNVILIGRGAHLVTSSIAGVLHVRLVGSFEKRVKHIQQVFGLTAREAGKLIAVEDRGRKRYLKKYFDKDVDDPLLYHLTINTDLVPYERAAWMIVEEVFDRIRARKLADRQTPGRFSIPIATSDATADEMPFRAG